MSGTASETNHAARRRPFGSMLIFVGAVSIGVVSYWSELTRAFEFWSRSADEQHGFLVIPVALLLLYLRRDTLPREDARIDLRGLLLIAIATGIRIYAERYVTTWLGVWSFPLWLGGAVWLCFGWKIFRWSAPAIAFLFFMAPLPGRMQTVAGYPLQIFAANAAGWLLQIMGQPVFIAGTTILLDDHVLDVERACAGLRMFHGMLAVAFAWSLFCRYQWKRFLATMALAPVIAIGVNVLRIAVTGLLYASAGTEVAQTFAHDWAGLAMIPLGALLFFLIDGWTERWIQWNRTRPDRRPRIAIAALVGVVVLCLGTILLRERQRQRSLEVVLEQARSLGLSEDQDERLQAVDYYQRYLSIRESDAEAISELAQLQSQMGREQAGRAARLFLLAWRKGNDRQADAIRCLELLQSSGRWQQLWNRAAEMLPQLSGEHRLTALRLRTTAIPQLLNNASSSIHPEALFQACLEAQRDDQDRFEHLWCQVLLIRSHPELVGSLPELKTAISKARNESLAEPLEQDTHSEPLSAVLDDAEFVALHWIDNSIQNHPDAVEPRLYRASLLNSLATGNWTPNQRENLDREINASLDEAIRLLEDGVPDDPTRQLTAYDLDPENSTVAAIAYQMAGERAFDRGNVEQARRLLSISRQLNPENHRVYHALAGTLDPDATGQQIELFESAIEACGTNELTLALPLAEAYMSANRQDDAEALLEPFERLLPLLDRTTRGRVELLLAITRASGLANQQKHREAATELSASLSSPQVLSQRLNFTKLYSQAKFLLGRLYRELGQDAAAAAAFREGGRFDPDSPAWNIDAGKSSEASGNLTAALEHYERAAAVVGDREPLVYLAVARVLLSQPGVISQQNINRARQIIRQAIEQGVDVDLSTAMMAESYVVTGDLAAALDVIDRQLEQTPNLPRLLFSKAMILQLAGKLDEAIEETIRYEEAGAAPADALLLRTLIYQRAGQLDKAASAIEEASNQLTELELQDARIQLVISQLEQGELAAGVAGLERLAEQFPSDLAIQRTAAEVFGDLRREEAVKSAEANLRSIEGDEGEFWRATRAARLLRQVADHHNENDVQRLRERARALINELRQSFPNWPTTYRLWGQLAEQSGRWTESLTAYQLAWSTGERDAELAAQILNALNRSGQGSQVADFIAEMEDLVPRSTSLFDRAMPAYVRVNRGDFVLQIARQWAQENPSPENLVRLGQTLMAITASRSDQQASPVNRSREESILEAESVLSKAVERAPTNVNAWIALFHLHSEIRKDRDRAFQELNKLSNQLSIDPLEKSFVLAQLNAAIGEDARAGELFAHTIQMATDAPASSRESILLTAIDFWSTRRPEYALQLGRQLIHEDPNSISANNRLIQLLANKNTEQSLDEAIARQIELNALREDGDQQSTRRLAEWLAARADLEHANRDSQHSDAAGANAENQTTPQQSRQVTTLRSSGEREQAIQLLESIVPKTAQDAERLAELYAKTGQTLRAFNFHRESLRLELATPERLVKFLDFWNDAYAAEGKYQAIADQYLRELSSYPDRATEWLRLSLQRVRIQQDEREQTTRENASGATAEVEQTTEVLDHFVEQFTEDAGPIDTQGISNQMLEGLATASRADLFPEAIVRLRQAGIDEDTIGRALAVTSIRLSNRKSRASDVRDALVAAMSKIVRDDGASTETLSSETRTVIGDAMYLAGDFGLALESYRAAIKLFPDNVDAINNLAIVLADQDPTDDKAMKLAERAVRLEPQNPDRRDTQLVVALLQRDWDLAESVSETLLDEYAPHVLLHRAYLALMQKRIPDAKQLFNRCREADIESVLVAPMDKRMYQTLAEEFLPSQSSTQKASARPINRQAANDLFGSRLFVFLGNGDRIACLGG